MKISKFLNIISEQPTQQAGFGGAPGTQATTSPAQAPAQAPAPVQTPTRKVAEVPPAPPAPKPKKEAAAAFTADQIKQIKEIVSKEVTKFIKAQVGAEL